MERALSRQRLSRLSRSTIGSVAACVQRSAPYGSRKTCTLHGERASGAARDAGRATLRLSDHRRAPPPLPLSAPGLSIGRSGILPPLAESLPIPEKSVFRRQLPEDLVEFNSTLGRRYFAEAMSSGHLEPYFPLSEQFVTQDEPTYCGLATLTMVMNALRIDPRRRWRDASGPGWRWWADEMFCSRFVGPSLEQIRAIGTTMDEFHLLAVANGAESRMRRATDAGETLDSFRESMVAACASPRAFAVTSFCREVLGQTGHGHFSPVGGYHAATDSVLILDVARFKYPPYWVPLPQLWEACLDVDSNTGRARGWFELSRPAHLPSGPSNRWCTN